MEIVRAVDADLAFIIENSGQAMQDGTRGLVQASDKQKVQELITAVLDRGGYYLVVKAEEQVLGWIMLGTNKDSFTDEEVGFIYELYVFPEQRGRGLGKKLMEHGIAELRANGYGEIRLNVFAGNPAQQLYESLGFQVRNVQMKLN